MKTSDQILSDLQLDRFFDEAGFSYDLTAGTVKNPLHTRIVYVSSDLMRGIYQALHEETAEAWKIIFKNCGRTWGKRVAQKLDRDLAQVGKGSQADLPLEAYVAFIEQYFRAHGWGVLQLDLADAATHGLVTARLTRSYFVEVLNDVDDHVDPLLAGILAGFFEHISGADLSCIEIACARRGAPHCAFAVTAPARLDAIDSMIGVESADAIIAALKKKA
jgi:predicted hydrocarbon binding protein